MRSVAAAYVTCTLIWGTTWFAIRACIAPGGYSTFDAAALRFVIAIAVLLPIAALMRPWPTRREWLWLVIAGVLDGCGYLLVYLGEERVPGAIAAVVYGTQPLILAVLLTAVRMERITRRHMIGAAISLSGVIVLFLDRLDVSASQAVGVALILGSVVVSTVYSMIMKRHTAGCHGLVSTAIFLTVTALVLVVVALAAGEPLPEWPPPLVPTIALLYLALIGSAVAFVVYFWLLGRTSLLVTSTLVFVYPLVALAIDAAFERDLPVAGRTYVGAAIVLAGLGVSLRRA